MTAEIRIIESQPRWAKVLYLSPRLWKRIKEKGPGWVKGLGVGVQVNHSLRGQSFAWGCNP